MDIILYSIKYTGTHFLLGLFACHPSISMFIGRGFKYSDTVCATYQRQLCNDKIDSQDFISMMNQYKIPRCRIRAMQYDMDLLGFPMFTQGLHKLHQIHYEGNYGHKWTNDFKVVIPIRDPLQVVLSNMRRGVNDEPELMTIGFEYLFDLKNVFYFPVDLWSSKIDLCLSVFDYLDIEPTLASMKYIEKYPMYGSLKTEKWRIKRFLSNKFAGEVEEAEQMLLENKIHPMLEEPVRVIRGLGIKEHFKNLGYKDLLWY